MSKYFPSQIDDTSSRCNPLFFLIEDHTCDININKDIFETSFSPHFPTEDCPLKHYSVPVD